MAFFYSLQYKVKLILGGQIWMHWFSKPSHRGFTQRFTRCNGHSLRLIKAADCDEKQLPVLTVTTSWHIFSSITIYLNAHNQTHVPPSRQGAHTIAVPSFPLATSAPLQRPIAVPLLSFLQMLFTDKRMRMSCTIWGTKMYDSMVKPSLNVLEYRIWRFSFKGTEYLVDFF